MPEYLNFSAGVFVAAIPPATVENSVENFVRESLDVPSQPTCKSSSGICGRERKIVFYQP